MRNENELISRQAALKLANHLKDDLPDDKQIADVVIAHNEGVLEYQIALSLLPFAQPEHLLPSAQPEQRWIPCSEGFPDEETDVYICNANGDVAISRGSYSTEAKDDFIWYTSGWRFGKVIAWMPLPEPYREEGEQV